MRTNNLAPVAVYTYTRLHHLRLTIEALMANHLAKDSTIYIVSDGAKNESDKKLVNQLRQYVDGLNGFREIVRVYRTKNLGVGISPALAEREIVSDHGRIINMEDDIITSPNFLDYLNQGLSHFDDNHSIFSVCGYTPPDTNKTGENADWWPYQWNMAWGYGTWKERFDRVYPLVNKYPAFKKAGTISKIIKNGGLYIADSLRRDYLGQGKFLDAILCARMTELEMYSVIPTVSKVQNIGLDGSGTSTKRVTNKYSVVIDRGERRTFDFSKSSELSVKRRNSAIHFFNGGMLTRVARRLGCYYSLSRVKQSIIG